MPTSNRPTCRSQNGNASPNPGTAAPLAIASGATRQSAPQPERFGDGRGLALHDLQRAGESKTAYPVSDSPPAEPVASFLPPRGGREILESPLGATIYNLPYSMLPANKTVLIIVGCFLLSYITLYRRFIQNHSAYTIPTRPEMLSRNATILQQLAMNPHCTLPLQKTDHARKTVLWRHPQAHVNMIRHKWPSMTSTPRCRASSRRIYLIRRLT